MDSQSRYSHADPVKLISNILREPALRSEGKSQETPAEIPGKSVPASHPQDESSEMAAESSTFSARDGAELPRLKKGSPHLRAAPWRFLVLCLEPVSCRLRDYLLAPLHVKLDSQAIAVERIQLQVQAIRADLKVLPKQLVQLEFRTRNFATQLAHLESQLSSLADQLKHLESQGGNVHGPIERHKPMDHP
jgi:hypothetical protein